jgi:hypothetical protein
LTTKSQRFTINHISGGKESVVAKDGDNDVAIVCVYRGKHQAMAMRPVEQEPTPPTPAFARCVALGILDGAKGGYRSRQHFRDQMAARQFDVLDMLYAIRNGQCVEGGKYSSEHKNFKYTFRGCIDGVEFDAVFALSAEHDLLTSPLMLLITGVWKTKSGKRGKTY